MAAGRVHLAVLGAGAAGMMTALLAARRGLSVALVDPHFSAPNNLCISGGLFPAAGSPLQRAAGISDSSQAWLDDLRAFAGMAVNEDIAPAIAAALPQLTGYLVTEAGAPIRFLADVPAPGHRVARFHAVTPASGRALHAWLRQMIAAEARVRCVVDRPLDAVNRGARGFEICADGHDVDADTLMLAGGGFGGNPDMVGQYIADMRGAQNSGAASNDGSVIMLARGWGAALTGMDGYQGQGHANPGGRTRLGMSLPALGAVLVNCAGRRFVREDVGPSALAAHVLAQPGQRALEIFDRQIEGQLGNHSAYADAQAAGQIFSADSVAALAAAAGIDAAALATTLADCARFARDSAGVGDASADSAASRGAESGVAEPGAAESASANLPGADPLGRRNFARVLAPPYCASWVTGTLAHTQGGVCTNASAQVLDVHGQTIPALFAAGGCAAGLSGQGGDGYLPGNGLAQSFGLAWLAIAAICQ